MKIAACKIILLVAAITLASSKVHAQIAKDTNLISPPPKSAEIIYDSITIIYSFVIDENGILGRIKAVKVDGCKTCSKKVKREYIKKGSQTLKASFMSEQEYGDRKTRFKHAASYYEVPVKFFITEDTDLNNTD